MSTSEWSNVSMTTELATEFCEVGKRVEYSTPPREISERVPCPTPAIDYPVWEILLKILTYLPVILLAVFGNLLVIVTILRKRRLHTTTNLLLINLAASDIMMALTCMWVHLGVNLVQDWPFGSFICITNTFLQYLGVTSSVLSLIAIAVNRFFAIVFPLRARVGNNGVLLSMATIWLVSAIYAAPSMFFMQLGEIFWLDRHEIWCEQSWPRYYQRAETGECVVHKPSDQMIYLTVGFGLLYSVPVAVMIIVYAVIWYSLIRRQHVSLDLPTSSVLEVHKRTRKKVMWLLSVVLVVFVICWTPLQGLLLWDALVLYKDDKLPEYIWEIKYCFTFLAYSNSAINPVLYAGINESIRLACKDTLRLVFRCYNRQIHPAPSSVRPHPPVLTAMAGSKTTLLTPPIQKRTPHSPLTSRQHLTVQEASSPPPSIDLFHSDVTSNAGPLPQNKNGAPRIKLSTIDEQQSTDLMTFDTVLSSDSVGEAEFRHRSQSVPDSSQASGGETATSKAKTRSKSASSFPEKDVEFVTRQTYSWSVRTPGGDVFHEVIRVSGYAPKRPEDIENTPI